MSDDLLKTTMLLTSPTFLKGASRVVDLYGKLDEYAYSDNADFFALKNDWENIGATIYISIGNYDQKQAKKEAKELAKTAK